jgi:2-hydroxychromene-2-carboxylate isomerase
LTAPVEIWFEFSSTYSYLTVMRAEPELKTAGLAFVRRPFSARTDPEAAGVLDVSVHPRSAARPDMWRDLERGRPFSGCLSGVRCSSRCTASPRRA